MAIWLMIKLLYPVSNCAITYLIVFIARRQFGSILTHCLLFHMTMFTIEKNHFKNILDINKKKKPNLIRWLLASCCHLTSLFVLLPLRFDSFAAAVINSVSYSLFRIIFRSFCCFTADDTDDNPGEEDERPPMTMPPPPPLCDNFSMWICFLCNSSSRRRILCWAFVSAVSKMPMWFRCSCSVARWATNSISCRSLAAPSSLSAISI